jgi:hypothetical protein
VKPLVEGGMALRLARVERIGRETRVVINPTLAAP